MKPVGDRVGNLLDTEVIDVAEALELAAVAACVIVGLESTNPVGPVGHNHTEAAVLYVVA